MGIEGEVVWFGLKEGVIDRRNLRPEAKLEDVDSVVQNVGIKWREVGRMGSL